MTGVAGPGGGTPEKPVGLVFLHAAGAGASAATFALRLPGDREMIRSALDRRGAPPRPAPSDTESARRRRDPAPLASEDGMSDCALPRAPASRTTLDTSPTGRRGTSRADAAARPPSTSTSRSRSSAPGPARSCRRSSTRCATQRRRRRADRARAEPAGARRGASGWSSSTTHGGARHGSPATSTAGSSALGVYRREARPWLPHLTVLRFRERPRLRPAAARDRDIRSVRRRCLPISPAPVRRPVRGARSTSR